MLVLKLICFIVVCIDVIAYIGEKFEKKIDAVSATGITLGFLIRLYALYGLFTYWFIK